MIAAIVLLALCLAACSASDAEYRVAKMSISTPNGIEYSRKWTDGCTMRAEGKRYEIELKGRGHSTYKQAKHPYTIKLEHKQSLLGLPPHRKYALVSNIFDHSLMRNALAFEIARQTSLAKTTSHGRFVALDVNGEKQGLYYLCERPKDIVKDKIICIDAYDFEEKGNREEVMLMLEHADIDTLSFVDYWIVQELCMNGELHGPRNGYAHYAKDKVVKAGPVWDFDLAFNECGIDDGGDLRPTKFKAMKQLPPFLKGKTITWLTVDSVFNRTTLIYGCLLRDNVFRSRIKARWQQLRPRFTSLLPLLDEWDSQIRGEAVSDQEKWNVHDPARFDDFPTYQLSLHNLKRIFRRRLEKLDSIIRGGGY